MRGVIADTFVKFIRRVVVDVLASIIRPESIVERLVVTPVSAFQRLGLDAVALFLARP